MRAWEISIFHQLFSVLIYRKFSARRPLHEIPKAPEKVAFHFRTWNLVGIMHNINNSLLRGKSGKRFSQCWRLRLFFLFSGDYTKSFRKALKYWVCRLIRNKILFLHHSDFKRANICWVWESKSQTILRHIAQRGDYYVLVFDLSRLRSFEKLLRKAFSIFSKLRNKSNRFRQISIGICNRIMLWCHKFFRCSSLSMVTSQLSNASIPSISLGRFKK